MPDIFLDSPLGQAWGVIGRYPSPGERYVFEFDAVRHRLVHMLGVRQPLRVQWRVDGACVADEVLRPWTGWGRHPADEIVEARP